MFYITYINKWGRSTTTYTDNPDHDIEFLVWVHAKVLAVGMI